MSGPTRVTDNNSANQRPKLVHEGTCMSALHYQALLMTQNHMIRNPKNILRG